MASMAMHAGSDIVQHIAGCRESSTDPPPQQAQIQRDRHQVVADFVGDVRGHLPQVGQAILARPARGS